MVGRRLLFILEKGLEAALDVFLYGDLGLRASPLGAEENVAGGSAGKAFGGVWQSPEGFAT